MLCKDCKFWMRTGNRSGECDNADTLTDSWVRGKGFVTDEPDEDGMSISASASDDSGLVAILITGESFGCIQFSPKVKTN